MSENLDELMVVGGPTSPMIHRTKIESNLYKVYLDEDIEEPSLYRELMTILMDAMEGDEIQLIINSSGGRLDTALAIIELIKSSLAEVTAVLVGDCHSAASIIAMNCKNVAVTNAANMMVHSGSFETGGSNSNVRRQVEFLHKKINDVIDENYSGFLSDEELIDVKNGVEFWFDSSELKTRLESRNLYNNSI